MKEIEEERRLPAPKPLGLACDGPILIGRLWRSMRRATGRGRFHWNALGMTIVDGRFNLVTSDEEFENLQLTVVDARGLAFDGSRFWTSHRDNNEIVAFSLP